ncbi:hypothetical protein BC351_10700 [Paenibacillus ferrarius]|uniref:Uncharacterized protein n=1 Tax=Paenibacillus ferrarius TaxID=1469647 RepID=A0A1V4H8V6_9BACL|nr:hypothetical protein [Paenibacillus ferrarius]OPH47650.1 hypothetical protein BC351_10700 [Paenibacillus ferrarius]
MRNNELWSLLEKQLNFPEEDKKNPFYLIHLKINPSQDTDAFVLNPNSPSHLEWWYENEHEKWKIIEEHGFELLMILESENITLKDAADKLIEFYQSK